MSAPAGDSAIAPIHELDLRGVACPLNWVRTRLALEAMAEAERLVVCLDPGQPLESVARSAAEDGHEVELDGHRVRIVRR
jgi:tRNA 2-thiouridine synthesizing protein A